MTNPFETNQLEATMDFSITVSHDKDGYRGSITVDGWSLFPEHKPLWALSITALAAMKSLGIEPFDLEEGVPFLFRTNTTPEFQVDLEYEEVVRYAAEAAKYEAVQEPSNSATLPYRVV